MQIGRTVTDHQFTSSALAACCGAMVLVLGCSGVELQDGIYACTANVPGACPRGWHCRPAPDSGEYRCFASASDTCGNGVIDGLEECDGPELEGATCQTAGYAAGELGCTVGCAFDMSACTDTLCGSPCPEDGFACVGIDAIHATCAPVCETDLTCADPQRTCCFEQGCVDLQSDLNNCGECGGFCEGNCISGVCVDPCGNMCSSGDTCCNGTCSNTTSDTNNCGVCGNICDSEESNACVNGSCKCGSSNACDVASGAECCTTSCKYVATDVTNCGGCGIACAIGETCQNGSCMCGSGAACTGTQGCCGSQCVDLQSEQYCGSCSNSCAANESCVSGQCESTAHLADGEDCLGNSQCESGHCTTIEVYHNPTWVDFHVCSRACCTESDCGIGFACMYHQGVKMCIPDSVYPPGFTFTQSAGQPCGANGPYCRSGFCNPAFNTCFRTCCESSDCSGDACVWYDDTTSGVMFELCADITGLPNTHTGAFCSGPTECQSFICIANQCADMCCSNSDCPGGYLCAQTLGQSTNPVVTTACLQGNPGTSADGAACTQGDAPSPHCQSGLCAAGTCRRPCCSNFDCAGTERCLPVPSGFDFNSDGTSEFVRACMP